MLPVTCHEMAVRKKFRKTKLRAMRTSYVTLPGSMYSVSISYSECKKNYYETKISRLSKNYGFLCFVSDFPSRPDLNNLVFLVSHWSKNQNHGQFDVVMFVRFDRNNRLINLTSYSGKRIKRIET